jgi:solute:Na+ symporter, SSS family
VPSLWVWQASFWIIGVMLVWWLAYRSGLSTVEGAFRVRELQNLHGAATARRQPRWIALLVTRLAARQNDTTSRTQRLR